MNKDIEFHRQKLRDYIKMLDEIPETSVLGRMCIKSYIAKEKKIIEKLRAEKNENNA